MTVQIDKVSNQILMSNFSREDICLAYEWMLRVGVITFPGCTSRNTMITAMRAIQAYVSGQYPSGSTYYPSTVYLIGNNAIIALSTNMQVSSVNLVSGEADYCMVQLIKTRVS
jgi:hypothetical protein